MIMSPRDWGLLLLLSLLWGGAFFFVGVAVRDLPPLTIVLARTGFAALALWLYLMLTGARFGALRPAIGAFLVMGFLNNLVPFSLLFWAQTAISSGLASILNATTPIFAMLVAHWTLADERMAPHKLAGILAGVAGVAVLLGADLLSGADIGSLGMIACLGAALSYGIASVFGRRFRGLGLTPPQVALGQLTATTAMMAPLVAIADRPWNLPMPGAETLAALAGLAILSTAVAYILYFRLLATAGAVNVALVTLLIPPSAILLGALFLDERLAPHQGLGLLLIGVGLVAIDGRLLRRRGGRRRRREGPTQPSR